jgi:large subunit ribosomal protein L6
MSRTGKKPIDIPEGVDVKINDLFVEVKGPKGQLSRQLIPGVSLEMKDNQIIVRRDSDRPEHRSLHGLSRTLINNLIVGVTKGYEKVLEIRGVGYRVKLEGTKLVLNMGYSHPVEMEAPEGIKFEVDEKKNLIKVMGIDKELVGQTAANIRMVRKVEPYKGKGIRYLGEHVIQKVGKRAK